VRIKHIDTNVAAELLRPAPAVQVEAWRSALDGARVYFTAVGEADLRHGMAILPVSSTARLPLSPTQSRPLWPPETLATLMGARLQ
jgi:predicted nucleic acid-binding protein